MTAHVELKFRGKWIHWDHPSIPRDYTLFAKVAGVRGEPSDAIVPPRGLPADLSETTALHYGWVSDGSHTPSWLGADEIQQVERWHRQQVRDSRGIIPAFGWGPQQSMIYRDEVEIDGIEDVRVVFWFDG